MMNVELPEASSLQRTIAVMRKIDDILKHEPGVLYYNAISGFSILSQTTSSRSGLVLLSADALSGTQNGGAAVRCDRRFGESQARGTAGRAGFRVPAAGDSRNRPGLGRRFLRPGSLGRHDVDYLWQNTQKFLAAARKRPELAGMTLHLQSCGAADVRGGGQGQGVQARRFDRQRLSRAADPARRLLREPVQPLRTRVEGLRRGGAAVSGQGDGRRTVLRDQQAPARWSRCRRWSICSAYSAPNLPRASTSIAASRSSPLRRPATALATR